METRRGAVSAVAFNGVSKDYPLYHHITGGMKNFLFNLPGAVRQMRKGRFSALEGISFEIEKGETFAVIGKNGAGKSTLLSLIAGVIKPTDGSITVTGRVSPLLELGAGFHPELTGRENIMLNGILLGLTKNEVKERLSGIIEFSGIGDFIDVPLRTYSSGMLARLGFSVAAHIDPDILLIDEILAVGDIEFQKKCADKIAEFKRKGVTIVLVSHSLGEVEKVADRVMWIESRSIREIGQPGDVIGRYCATEWPPDKSKGEFIMEEKHEESFKNVLTPLGLAMRMRRFLNDAFHPAIKFLNPLLLRNREVEVSVVEEDYKGFNILSVAGGSYYGLAQEEGAFSVKKFLKGKYRRSVVGKTVSEVRRLIDDIPPHDGKVTLIEESYRGFNILHYGGKFYALAMEEGSFDIKKIEKNKYRRWVAGKSVEEVKGFIDREPYEEKPLLHTGYRGFNIVFHAGTFYGLSRNEGTFSVKKAAEKGYKACLEGKSVDEIKRLVDEIMFKETRPTLYAQGYRGFNIVRFGEKFYALQQNEGAFDFKKFSDGGYKVCVSGSSNSEVKRLIKGLDSASRGKTAAVEKVPLEKNI